MNISDQQLNTAIGTAFAFLVRACLMHSISLAYFQILIWTVRSRGTNSTKLGDLDVMTDALQNILSLLNYRTWRRRPWLWVLAVVAWLLPIASIITPATLSISVDFPPAAYMNVPTVDFTSLNLAAPMPAFYISEGSLSYNYAGPSLTVQRIADAVAAQGSILPVTAPAVNSSWNVAFNGPSLHCNPIVSDFRREVLDNVLNYTFGRCGVSSTENCTFGPGYVAWHPGFMAPLKPMKDYLPFSADFSVDESGPLTLQSDNHYGDPAPDMASVFILVAPVLSSSSTVQVEGSNYPTMCAGKPWYQDGLAKYYETSLLLRCDVYNSTFDTTFSVVNSAQTIHVNNITDLTKSPLIANASVKAEFNSTDRDNNSFNRTTAIHMIRLHPAYLILRSCQHCPIKLSCTLSRIW